MQPRTFCNVDDISVSLAQASIARAADQTALAVSLRLAGHTVGNVTTEEGETNYLQRLGQTIAEVRILAGLSQDQLASRLGRSAAALSRWENGKVAPTAWDLRRLADLLAVPADLLLYPPERPPSPVEIRLQQAVRDGLREAEVRDRRERRSGLGRGGRPRRSPPAGPA